MSSADTNPSTLAKNARIIDHIAIAVRDLEQAIDWYTRVMGFTLRERRRTEGTKTAMVSAVVEAGPLTFVLLQGASPESQVSRYVEHYGPGVQHIALAVENLHDVAEALRADGMEYDTNVIDGPGLRQIFTHREPNSGMMFEIIERHGGDFSDQSVQQLFQQLEDKDSF